MLIKRSTFFVFFILVSVVAVKSCWAIKSSSSFQNIWSNDYGNIAITRCKEMKCRIRIVTANGAHTCDLAGELTVLSHREAIFPIDKAKIKLVLAKEKLIVIVPKERRDVTNQYCGINGFFDGEYFAPNISRTYKTSFNCEKAGTKVEIAVCHSKNLAHADQVLSELYLQLKAKQFKNIISLQKEWVKERDLCSNSLDLNQCLFDKYRERILILQHNIVNDLDIDEKKIVSLPYSFDYLRTRHGIFQDPPLQHYLKANLPKNIYEKILPASFNFIDHENHNDDLLIVQGATPGLYTICEGALVLTKKYETWLAYIDFNNKNEKQIVVICPKKSNLTSLPSPLKEWISSKDCKNIIYKKLFPVG